MCHKGKSVALFFLSLHERTSIFDNINFHMFAYNSSHLAGWIFHSVVSMLHNSYITVDDEGDNGLLWKYSVWIWKVFTIFFIRSKFWLYMISLRKWRHSGGTPPKNNWNWAFGVKFSGWFFSKIFLPVSLHVSKIMSLGTSFIRIWMIEFLFVIFIELL